MRIDPIEFRAFRILEAQGLDPITVLLRDVPRPPPTRAGHVIVECYGHAWACYFGSIGERSLVEFLSADAEYLAGKLSRGTEKKADRAYLLRVAQAVTAACAELAATQPERDGRGNGPALD